MGPKHVGGGVEGVATPLDFKDFEKQFYINCSHNMLLYTTRSHRPTRYSKLVIIDQKGVVN